MSQSRKPTSVDDATRSVITRSQAINLNSISLFKACEVTRDFRALVNTLLDDEDEVEYEVNDDGDVESLFHSSAATLSSFADSGSERSYGTSLTTPDVTPNASPVKSYKANKTLNRRSRSVGEFRFPSLQPYIPTTRQAQITLISEKPLPPIVADDPFAASGDSYIAGDVTVSAATPPPSVRTRSSSITSRRWLTSVERTPPSSQPPTSFPRSASEYAHSLNSTRRGTSSKASSSEMRAPLTVGKGTTNITSPPNLPTHRRRTSSLSSIDNALAHASSTVTNVATNIKRALHLRSSSKASASRIEPLQYGQSNKSRTTSPTSTSTTRFSGRSAQYPGAAGGPPNLPLPRLPPPPSLIPSTSYSSLNSSKSHSSASSENIQEGQNNLPAGVPVGRDRDLLMWRTEADADRRAGFICTTDRDFAALRLRTEDDCEDLSFEELQQYINAGGKPTIGSLLAQPRAVVEHRNKKNPIMHQAPVESTADVLYRLGRLDDLNRYQTREVGLDSNRRRSRKQSWVG